MLVKEKEIVLKNGQKCLLRSPKPEEAQEMLDFLKTCAFETKFLLRYPEEVTVLLFSEKENTELFFKTELV